MPIRGDRSGSTLTIGVHGTAGDFDQQDGDENPMWTRLERNWMADVALAPGGWLRHTPSGEAQSGRH